MLQQVTHRVRCLASERPHKIVACKNEVFIVKWYRNLKPGLHLNANKMQTRHAKTKPSFNIGVLSRRGKQHSAVRTFGEQPNAISRMSVHHREFAYNIFIYGRFAASVNAEQCTNVP